MHLHPRGPTPISRRRFLATAAAVTGALTAPHLAQGQAMAHWQTPYRIGLVAPASRWFPGLGPALADGLRLGLAGTGASLSVHHCGAVPSAVAQTARTLTQPGQFDLLVAVAAPQTLAGLAPDLEDAGVPLVAVEAGAHAPTAARPSSYIVQNTLQLWQSHWALGDWAARRMGSRGVILSSLYESGYDSLQALRLGFAAAGGSAGEPVVTQRESDLLAALSAIRQDKPDVVFALYSGPEAAQFVSAWKAAELDGQVPLAGSAFLDAAAGGVACTSCLAWTPLLPTPETRDFVSAYITAYGEPPNPFALLGYDTALLIRRAADAGNLRDGLRSAHWQSPRGRVSIDPATGAASGPLYVWKAGEPPVLLAANAPVSPNDPRLASLHGGLRSGWTNAYLCV